MKPYKIDTKTNEVLEVQCLFCAKFGREREQGEGATATGAASKSDDGGSGDEDADEEAGDGAESASAKKKRKIRALTQNVRYVSATVLRGIVR